MITTHVSVCWNDYKMFGSALKGLCPELSVLAEDAENSSYWLDEAKTTVKCLRLYLPMLHIVLLSSDFCESDRLAGLVVKVSVSGAEDPGFESRLRRDFSGSSHTSDFKIGTPVATLPGAWRYRLSAGSGRPGVSIL